MPIITILIVDDFRPDAEKLKTLLEKTNLLFCFAKEKNTISLFLKDFLYIIINVS